MMNQRRLVAMRRRSQESPVEVVQRQVVDCVQVQLPRRECVLQRLVMAGRRSKGRQPAWDLELDPAAGVAPQEAVVVSRHRQPGEQHDHWSCRLRVLVLGPLGPSMHDALQVEVADRHVQEALHQVL